MSGTTSSLPKVNIVKTEIKKEKNVFFEYNEAEISEVSDNNMEEELADISDVESVQTNENDINDLGNLIEATKKIEKEEVKRHTMSPKKVDEREPDVQTRVEQVDDFIRNFFIKHNLKQSLDTFQQEWYENVKKDVVNPAHVGEIPDVYLDNQNLQEQVSVLKKELETSKKTSAKQKETWEKLRKGRDFHKMHHHRVQQEKERLNQEIDKLKKLHLVYEERYQELSTKYEAAMKEKNLLKLERERLTIKVEGLQKNLNNFEERNKAKEEEEFGDHVLSKKPTGGATAPQKTTKRAGPKLTPFPPDERPNPYLNTTFESYNTNNIVPTKSLRGHQMGISCVAMHPRKSIIATGSDDLTWKIWTIPSLDLIMSGESHREWVSGVAFHPKGSHLLTCSGDSTVKIWDFLNASNPHTFKDHIQPVWAISFNDSGDFAVTGSMDHSSKLLDLNALRARNTFRGHVDSVNHVQFQPFSNIFASASADKTVSLWDIRSGLCIQTFYGHLNAVNHLSFSLVGDSLASCDADGIVKVWDIRNVRERSQFDIGKESGAANSCAWDKSSTILAVACEDGSARLFNEETKKPIDKKLEGYDSKASDVSVQDVVFDYNSKMIVTVSNDCHIRVFN